ncbi:YkvA family protein [Flavobacterium sp. CS20]|uniref:YkvA family protein n=1 Tax=Flavobacterium sp. CS20 TaxID=2775246 RepID=UPI001B3A1FD4|nr:YkvA family protein [Flavobacterium sp. CS20]QTY27428.1 DUF1232 domain-containing protein [Flavobacterium sp. CS20]
MKKTKHKPHIDKDFVSENAKQIDKDDLNKIHRKRKRLQKILNLKVFAQHRQKFKLLIEILQQYKKGTYKKIPWRSVASITFTLLYVINPFDIVPDVLPVIGFVDDISVFMALMRLIDEDINDFESWKST